MDPRRACIHEAGHFYLAFKHRPGRAHSICYSKQAKTDSATGEEYDSLGETVTVDPRNGSVRVQVRLRAGGLAAESIVYKESYEDLMGRPHSTIPNQDGYGPRKTRSGKSGVVVPLIERRGISLLLAHVLCRCCDYDGQFARQATPHCRLLPSQS